MRAGLILFVIAGCRYGDNQPVEVPVEVPDAAVVVDSTIVEAPTTEVCFTPGEDCQARLCQAISQATKSVRVQAYTYTDWEITACLREVRNDKQVDVQVIMDAGFACGQYSQGQDAVNAGFAVFIDSAHQYAHNKIIIIDNDVVITGSYNLTRSANERNAENVLFVRSAELAAKYITNWDTHLSHSRNFSCDI